MIYSEDFVKALENVKVNAIIKIYEGWSHTDAILEMPMYDNHDFHRDLYHLLLMWTDDKSEGTIKSFDENYPALNKLCPSLLIFLAKIINPFLLSVLKVTGIDVF